ncbi:Uncharacterised protein [uncultured archaeon]|nr:Uncharacterised protein [uncultured archaeon]
MRPKIHLIIGIIFVVFLKIFFPNITWISLSIILFSSVLIDGDHYFYYILRTKNFSLIKCYAWYKKHLEETLALPMSGRKKRYTGFYVLHGIEPLIVLFLLGISVSQFFMFIFIGFLLHFIFDIPSEMIIKGTVHKISLIYSYTQFRKLEK